MMSVWGILSCCLQISQWIVDYSAVQSDSTAFMPAAVWVLLMTQGFTHTLQCGLY